MPLKVPAITGAMATAGGDYRWENLMEELLPLITSPPTPDAERLLLGILRFEGRLRLVVSHDMPHSMPPTEMLKSLAIQALARWTGLAYLHDMLKVQLTTASSSLASLVGDVISGVRGRITMPAADASEAVAETSSQQPMKVVTRPLGRERGMSYLRGPRTRKPARERELARAG